MEHDIEKLEQIAGDAPTISCRVCGAWARGGEVRGLDKPCPGGGIWYADCYCYTTPGGKDFPVNSYGPLGTEDISTVVRNVLNPDAGIDEVRIRRTTDGQAPMPHP